MTEIALRLGPLAAAGFDICRSGIRWLRQTGSTCARGDVLAFCNVALRPAEPSLTHPFEGERRDFQIALTAPSAGRLRIAPGTARGGTLDQLASRLWAEGDVICFIETSDKEADRSEPLDQVRLLMLSGRRMFELAEVRTGPLSGWHDRTRAWCGEADPDEMGALLGVGICDLTEVLRGPSQIFAELVQAAPGGAHIARFADEPMVPCTRILVEQFERTPAQMAEIAADLAKTVADGDGSPSSQDLIFVGSLLAGLQCRVLTDRYPLLTRVGLSQSRPPDAMVMSLNGEGAMLLRHRRLGYSCSLHGYRFGEASAWLQRWLVKNFERITRTTEDIKAEFSALLGHLGPNTAVLVLNAVADGPGEDIQTYQGLGAPLSRTVGSVRSKEMNLMLHDLSREHGLGLIDVDQIAAELGRTRHTIDTMHHSGAIQAEVRAEILAQLAAREVRGFRPHGVR